MQRSTWDAADYMEGHVTQQEQLPVEMLVLAESGTKNTEVTPPRDVYMHIITGNETRTSFKYCQKAALSADREYFGGTLCLDKTPGSPARAVAFWLTQMRAYGMSEKVFNDLYGRMATILGFQIRE